MSNLLTRHDQAWFSAGGSYYKAEEIRRIWGEAIWRMAINDDEATEIDDYKRAVEAICTQARSEMDEIIGQIAVESYSPDAA